MTLPQYSWVGSLREKSEAFDIVKALCKRLQCEQGNPIPKIRSDHGREFQNSNFDRFYDEEGTHQEFYAPITPQQEFPDYDSQ